MPQSNQRGIETDISWIREAWSACGLNRTSVGLKLPIDDDGDAGWGAGLNRTSVGLKLEAAVEQGILRAASIEPAWD